jgi:large subunit ribosomal protein L17
MIKNLADSLVWYGHVKTTLPKAKEVGPYVEKLITKAKVGDLASRRQILSALSTEACAHKLVDEIAPKLKNRTSGYLRITKAELRRGDNSQMAIISFVDDLSTIVEEKPVPASPQPIKEEATKRAPTAKGVTK